MVEGVRRSQRDYTLAFKLVVVGRVEKGEMSYKEAQARYGISDDPGDPWCAQLWWPFCRSRTPGSDYN